MIIQPIEDSANPTRNGYGFGAGLFAPWLGTAEAIYQYAGLYGQNMLEDAIERCPAMVGPALTVNVPPNSPGATFARPDLTIIPWDFGHRLNPGLPTYRRSMMPHQQVYDQRVMPAFPLRMGETTEGPSWWDDPQWDTGPTGTLPWVSFVGRLRPLIRRQCAAKCVADIHLRTIVRERDQFCSADDTARAEYLLSIHASHYVLCPVGVGMFSYRLYETMAAGRIPVIPPPVHALPDIGQTRWTDIAVFPQAPDGTDTPSAILEHFASIGNRWTMFVDLSAHIRYTWRKYLSPAAWAARVCKAQTMEELPR